MSASSSTADQKLAVRPGRVGRIALWTVQVVLAAMFFGSGLSKVTGSPAMVAMFETIGVGQWFRYLTGLIEVISAIALLVPSLAVFGAVALVPTMIGAIATHLFIIGGAPTGAVVLLIGSLIVTWARREQLLAALSRRR